MQILIATKLFIFRKFYFIHACLYTHTWFLVERWIAMYCGFTIMCIIFFFLIINRLLFWLISTYGNPIIKINTLLLFRYFQYVFYHSYRYNENIHSILFHFILRTAFYSFCIFMMVTIKFIFVYKYIRVPVIKIIIPHPIIP